MDPAKSRRLESSSAVAVLHIAVTGDVVTITDVVVDASGHEQRASIRSAPMARRTRPSTTTL
jgi:hypothetical protein